MEENTNVIQPLFEKAEQFAKTSIELYKLKGIDKLATAASNGAVGVTLILFFSIFFVLINMGIALWLGDVLGKSYYGFFCVAGLYGIAGSIFYFFMKDKMKNQIGNSIISKMLK